MDPRHLELLRELADRGSVAAVGSATHRTPSAVSQQLRSAQRDLGVRLVEPDGRGIRLTDAGRLLAEGATEVATALANVEARLDDFRGEATGTVSVAAFPSAAEMLFPPLLVAFADGPVDLRCTDAEAAEADYLRDVADHDVVVAHSLAPREAPPDLVAVPLMREPLDVALPADHPLASRTHLRPVDVVDEPWIGVPDGYPFDAVLHEVGDRTGRAPRVLQRLRQNETIAAVVATGLGVALLPRYTTKATGVVLLPLRGVRAGRRLTAWSRRDRAERLAVRTVVAELRRCADEVVARQG